MRTKTQVFLSGLFFSLIHLFHGFLVVYLLFGISAFEQFTIGCIVLFLCQGLLLVSLACKEITLFFKTKKNFIIFCGIFSFIASISCGLANPEWFPKTNYINLLPLYICIVSSLYFSMTLGIMGISKVFITKNAVNMFQTEGITLGKCVFDLVISSVLSITYIATYTHKNSYYISIFTFTVIPLCYYFIVGCLLEYYSIINNRDLHEIMV